MRGTHYKACAKWLLGARCICFDLEDIQPEEYEKMRSSKLSRLQEARKSNLKRLLEEIEEKIQELEDLKKEKEGLFQEIQDNE